MTHVCFFRISAVFPTRQFVVFVLTLACFGASWNSVRADGPRSAKDSVAALKVFDGLEAQLFAAEPMITNPTNIAVDERGRVWVCDVVNYRGNRGKRPEGDRILVLEDDDGDGQADRSTVFYQGHDVDSVLGICVLGERVIVSCSPDIFVLTDENGDGRADKKELLYTDTGGPQNDHSAHAFVFGPDGHLYWNMGNANHGVFDREGNVVFDQFGREVRNNGKPFRHGMAFRQNFAGDQFEVLAHNLRNSYELTIDAFGRVWFTDNDDDGNLGTRFCFTLDGGNYGYTDERTGEHWRAGQRTGMSEKIPLRHWHQNDPGSIPNVLNNGSGSPSGIEVYEGDLLPERLRGGIVHCEPGHNVVRVYQPTLEGAGYTAETIELVDGRSDPWFRPVDAATAPDGSLMIADWYDPGVGGNRQADINRGRIYRVAPRGALYHCQVQDVRDATAACDALCSGNNSVRYLAWTALAEMGVAAEPALEKLSKSGDARSRARAYWLLTRLSANGNVYLNRAATDPDQRVRAAAVRMAQFVSDAALPTLRTLADDPSPQVKMAVAIALRRHYRADDAPQLWAQLAEQFDGKDRWYLEALGLAAEMHWDRCLDAWLARVGKDAWKTPAGRLLIWRSRGKQTLEKLTALLADPSTPSEELPRLLRAIDFNEAKNHDELLVALAESALQRPDNRRVFVATEALKRVKSDSLGDREAMVLNHLLDDMPRDDSYAHLVKQFKISDRYDDLLTLALGPIADTRARVDALQFLIREERSELLKLKLNQGGDDRAKLVGMLIQTSEAKTGQLLMPIVMDAQADVELRREAIRALAANKNIAEQLVQLAEAGDLEQSMRTALLFGLRASPWTDLRERAKKLCPEQATANEEELPIVKWMKLRGDIKRGKKLFFADKATCATCHRVGDEGKEVGPALTEIGSKLSRTGMYEAILYPNAAISHNYESYLALTDAGVAITGVLIGETDDTVTLKTDKAVVHELVRDELEQFNKQNVSLMPGGMHKLVTPMEMADVVEYLLSLKRPPGAEAAQ